MPRIGLLLTPAALVGGLIGAALARQLNSATLRQLFGIFLLVHEHPHDRPDLLQPCLADGEWCVEAGVSIIKISQGLATCIGVKRQQSAILRG